VPRGREEPDDALPKLTFGQRILAALPNLQRQPPPARPQPAAPTGGKRSGSTARSDAGGNGTDVVQPDAVISPKAATTTGSRLRDAFLKPPPQGAKSPTELYAQMSVPDLRHAMKYLDDRERQVALFIGPLVGALDLALMFVTLHQHNPPVGHKGHFDPGQVVALGAGSAVVALLVVVAALFYGGSIVTLVPAWFAAGWLFIRFNRMQKVVVQKTRSASGGKQPAGRANADRNALRRGRKAKAPEPAGPPPSKRYTPPRATGSR
jgi:hypothetical protein